jgi:hypothetical protein
VLDRDPDRVRSVVRFCAGRAQICDLDLQIVAMRSDDSAGMQVAAYGANVILSERLQLLANADKGDGKSSQRHGKVFGGI